ncbi:uncharacterized protein LOC144818467 [Lissotriton helveticus]
MAEDYEERAPPFSERELGILVEGVLAKFPQLYGDPEHQLSTAARGRLWDNIAERCSTVGVSTRSARACRKRWEDLKRWARHKATELAGLSSQHHVHRPRLSPLYRKVLQAAWPSLHAQLEEHEQQGHSTVGETSDVQEQVRSRRPSVQWRLHPLSTSEEEEEKTSAGQGVLPTRDEEELKSGTTSRVEAVDIVGGEEGPDISDHDVVESHSPTHSSPVAHNEVSPGQANILPGPATCPSLSLESPMLSGAPARSSETWPPPRCRQAGQISSGPEAPHPFCPPPPTPPSVVPPVVVPEDLMWMVEGEPDRSARMLLQVCLEIRSMRAELVNLSTHIQAMSTAMTSFVSQTPSHTTVNVSPCPLPHTVFPRIPRVSRPHVVPVPALASRVDVSDPEDLDIVVLEDDQKDT